MEITYQIVTGKSEQTYQDALTIRKKVFIEEQQIDPLIELDCLDTETIHFVGYYKEQPVVTARLLKLVDQLGKVQRVAVLPAFREQGHARDLMNKVQEYAFQQKFMGLILGSQAHAVPFYEKLGYQKFGEPFIEAGIAHQTMKKLF
ncbi:GNAT family N-acetyltransferase [Isobaculum melis]|uniref:Predicted N-acyltransferase, GNAT family n=1 Tax=Isobaculum melis TaxID=142588 RepID=A0A1H9T9A0_9LACT|nr:GNAT family N-acetyltransferase [Isobaculum melis]SER93698.1 Predicted N-acyltransferase, GNAT family [Isobaculum melis]